MLVALDVFDPMVLQSSVVEEERGMGCSIWVKKTLVG